MGPSDLAAVFKILDDLHFDGRLGRNGWGIRSGCLHGDEAPIAVRNGEVYAYTFHDSVWGIAMPHAKTIVLDRRLLKEEPALRIVLLHEMVHAHVMTLGTAGRRGNTHGRRFVQELRRLVDRGEECLKAEVDYYAKRLR